MKSGYFYFLTDEYFKKFDDKDLKPNKERDADGQHGRPCYYAFKEKDSEIMWMIPISSKLEKYERIYNEKVKKFKNYDGIIFGYVMGKKKAFLIQNMSPTTDRYIANEYVDNATQGSIVIKDSLKSKLNASARKVVSLYRKGTKLVFPKILEIEKALLDELNAESEKDD